MWAVSLREIWFNINFHKLVWNKAQTGLGFLLAEAGCFFLSSFRSMFYFLLNFARYVTPCCLF